MQTPARLGCLPILEVLLRVLLGTIHYVLTKRSDLRNSEHLTPDGAKK